MVHLIEPINWNDSYDSYTSDETNESEDEVLSYKYKIQVVKKHLSKKNGEEIEMKIIGNFTNQKYVGIEAYIGENVYYKGFTHEDYFTGSLPMIMIVECIPDYIIVTSSKSLTTCEVVVS